MAFNKQLWMTDFAANLYDTKDWYRVGKNWSEYMSGSIVHIPQMGSVAPIVEYTSGSVSTVAQTFSDLTFANKMLVIPPTYVNAIDKAEASFDTRSAVLADGVNKLRQAMSIEIANSWLTVETGSIKRTTGSTTRTNIYGQASVKSLTYEDIIGARALLSVNDKDVDLNNIYMVIDPIFVTDLLQMDEFTNANELGSKTVVSGFIGEVAGIKVIQRASGIAVTAAVAKPATISYTDTYDNTHFSAAVLFDASKVGYSLGTVENGEINLGFEPYATGIYSDVLQGHTRVGASQKYEAVSNVVSGVVSIIEAV